MNARGMALVLVLWLLALLLGVVAAFALNARIEALQGRSSASLTQARLAAEAGLELAALRMGDRIPARRLVPDGRPYRIDFDGARVTVRVSDTSGRLNLNSVESATLARLFQYFEVEEERALALADAVTDWRDPDDLVGLRGAEASEYAAAGLPYGPANRPFSAVEELQRVLDMSREIYLQVAPHLTVHSSGAVNAVFAEAPVLFALGLQVDSGPDPFAPLTGRGAARTGFDDDSDDAPVDELDENGGRDRDDRGGRDDQTMTAVGSGTYSISSLAELVDGTRLTLQPTVSLAGTGATRPYSVLVWREGETD